MKNYKIFEAFKTNSVGVWYFIPNESAFQKGNPCKVFGCIKYAEGSVYTGDLYYDGKHFNKIGFGKQDFTQSNIGDVIEAIGERKYLFVVRYDYRKTDWIYGNGVVYYTDQDGKPTHFRKGFYSGLDKIGEYRGEFDYSRLLKGYTPDMEFNYDENAGRIETRLNAILFAIAKDNSVKVLLIGDSYFELSDNPEYAGKNTFPKDYVNAGVCGSQFSDWLGWIEKFKDIPAPERIVINLGFNDLHAGKPHERVYRDYKKFLKLLRGYFPNAKIYLICAVHCPNDINCYDEEVAYNSKAKASAAKHGVTVGDWNDRISASGANCFHSDAVHPNENGYGLFVQFLKELLER